MNQRQWAHKICNERRRCAVHARGDRRLCCGKDTGHHESRDAHGQLTGHEEWENGVGLEGGVELVGVVGVEDEQCRSDAKEQERSGEDGDGVGPNRPFRSRHIRHRHIALDDRHIGCVGDEILAEPAQDDDPEGRGGEARRSEVPVHHVQLVVFGGGGHESAQAAVHLRQDQDKAEKCAAEKNESLNRRMRWRRGGPTD